MASGSSSTSGGLNVIALVSGGKDSFFSLLHCQAQGHRVVALANLHPVRQQQPEERARPSADDSSASGTAAGATGVRPPPSAGVVADIAPAQPARQDGDAGCEAIGEEDEVEVEDEDEQDLNSFMYQTVGHTVIPLYAAATGIPLYRQPILGGAVQSARDYAPGEDAAGQDETESMVPLLRRVMAQHPEANAVSAGAILSTYQRTRVESVALRLGLTPLAYLWKFPVLPVPSSGGGDAQLLVDMAAAGLDARIVKVASGGLDESFLWGGVSAPATVARVRRAMGRFGTSERGAVLGEGGEFETLVVDGPRRLFRGQIAVREDDRSIVREGGGTAWVRVRKAEVLEKPTPATDVTADDGEVRIPEMLDERFKVLLEDLRLQSSELPSGVSPVSTDRSKAPVHRGTESLVQWSFVSDAESQSSSIEAETASLMGKLQSRLGSHSLSPSSIISTVIVLRHMSDFPTINKIYSAPFTEPNPPSRVTISCGELLPPGCNIVIYALAHTALKTGDRQGLHVQSRSYWAPANIGPYSQAITVPAGSLLKSVAQQSESSSARLVTIAGQIPLIPATMELPRGPDALKMQVVLSLQHLWRIGLEMGVQWWSSAVAYFPRGSDSGLPTKEKAQMAGRVWEASHALPQNAEEEEDDMDSGPDLWDRKYNPEYMYLGHGDGTAESAPQLPDWSVVDGSSTVEALRAIPAFFAAEVEELPREAGVEWHAHVGYSHLSSSSLHVCNRARPGSLPSYRWNIHECTLNAAGGGFVVQTALSAELVDETIHTELPPLSDMLKEARDTITQALTSSVKVPLLESMGDLTPYLVYAPTWAYAKDEIGKQLVSTGIPIVPCFSIRNARGQNLGLVALFRTIFDSD